MDYLAFKQGILRDHLLTFDVEIPEVWKPREVGQVHFFDISDFVIWGIPVDRVEVIRSWNGALPGLVLSQYDAMPWDVELIFAKSGALIENREFYALGMRIKVEEGQSDDIPWGAFRLLSMMEIVPEMSEEYVARWLIDRAYSRSSLSDALMGESPFTKFLEEVLVEYQDSDFESVDPISSDPILTESIKGLCELFWNQKGWAKKVYEPYDGYVLVYEGEWSEGPKGNGKISNDVRQWVGEFDGMDEFGFPRIKRGKMTLVDGGDDAPYFEGVFGEILSPDEGVWVFPGESVLEGKFVEDRELQGFGVIKAVNGIEKEGWFEKGVLHGEGKVILPNVGEFDGNFENGNQVGLGVWKFEDGRVYEGNFRDYRLNGHGKQLHVNGTIVEGEFKDDVLHGKVRILLANGSEFEGQYESGQKTGQGFNTWVNGSTFTGEFYQDERVSGVIKHEGVNYQGEIKTTRLNLLTARMTLRDDSGASFTFEYDDKGILKLIST